MTQTPDVAEGNSAKPFGVLAWIAVAVACLFGIAKAVVWSKGVFTAEVFGYALTGALVPLAIAYAIAGRQKVRNGTRFALWLVGFSLFFYLIERTSH